MCWLSKFDINYSNDWRGKKRCKVLHCKSFCLAGKIVIPNNVPLIIISLHIFYAFALHVFLTSIYEDVENSFSRVICVFVSAFHFAKIFSLIGWKANPGTRRYNRNFPEQRMTFAASPLFPLKPVGKKLPLHLHKIAMYILMSVFHHCCIWLRKIVVYQWDWQIWNWMQGSSPRMKKKKKSKTFKLLFHTESFQNFQGKIGKYPQVLFTLLIVFFSLFFYYY